MPEDKQNSSQAASSGTATVAPQAPKVDTSVLNQDQKQFDSAAVNLADPEEEKFSKYKGETKEANKGTINSASSTESSGAENAAQTEPAYQPPPPPQTGPDLPAGDPGGSKKAVIVVLVILLLLALIAGGTWWYLNSQPTDGEVTEEPAPTPEPAPAPTTMNISVDAQTTEDATPTVTGTVDNPDAAVTVTIDGIDYEATVSFDGTWSVDVDRSLAPGTYDIRVAAETIDGATATEDAVGALTILQPEPEPEPEPTPAPTPTPTPEPEPDTTPITGPRDGLPATGPR